MYHQTEELHEQGIHLISVDEKTGIQAIERDYPTRLADTGQVERIEYNYDRHGTQALMANFEVAIGKIISPTVEDTRTEVDYLLHLQQTVKTDPNGKWIFISDQLNTHKSASLVEWVAEECGVEENLGVKGKSGILENMVTRAKF